uniref:fatty acid-binding protein 2, liver-like n=1 Tax=Styela clava TaxID=7725 RepID=UPI00193A7B93|nr:fatty acid-binding protein 2, liver-like [Styela clava]
MSFGGKFVLESRNNYDEFAAASGASPEQIQRGKSVHPTTEISNNGDNYTVKRIFPNQTITNSFKLGVPTELSFVEGKKATATVTLEGGKLVMKGDKFSSVAEIEGGKLKETLTFNGKTMTRWSTKA